MIKNRKFGFVIAITMLAIGLAALLYVGGSVKAQGEYVWRPVEQPKMEYKLDELLEIHRNYLNLLHKRNDAIRKQNELLQHRILIKKGKMWFATYNLSDVHNYQASSVPGRPFVF